MTEENEALETIEIIYEAVKERLDIEIGAVDSMDSKAGMLIGFNGVILAVLFQVQAGDALWPFRVGLIALFLSLVSGGISFQVGKYRRDPDPRQLRRWYSQKKKREVLSTLIDNMVESYEEVRKKNRFKARYVQLSIYLMIVGVAFIIANWIWISLP